MDRHIRAINLRYEDYGKFFENLLNMKLPASTVERIYLKHLKCLKETCTVWNNSCPFYPDLRSLSIEDIHNFEQLMQCNPNFKSDFSFTQKQYEYLLGYPVAFDRQEGATLAFSALLLMQKGQPLLLDDTGAPLSYNDTALVTNHSRELLAETLHRIYKPYIGVEKFGKHVMRKCVKIPL